MTALSLIISVFLALPTIDRQRVELDAVAELPAWIGYSVPPGEIVDLELVYRGRSLVLDNFTGTDFEILYVWEPYPIQFYEYGVYSGQITPEPVSILYMLAGIVSFRRKKCLT